MKRKSGAILFDVMTYMEKRKEPIPLKDRREPCFKD